MQVSASKDRLSASEDEQKICLRCGLCCDGTLFLRAILGKNEKENLPEKINQNRFVGKKKEYFRLPCEYFDRKCTIYNLQRAEICSSFRCFLLKSLSEGGISTDDACAVVNDAVSMKDSIRNDFRKITGGKSDLPFRQILIELGTSQFSGPEFDLFKARCNIFEALLIKLFRADKDFEVYMQE